EPEAVAEALAEVDDQRVIGAFVERSEGANWSLREGRKEPGAQPPRFERDVRVPETEQIADVAVIVVGRDGHIRRQLALNADRESERIRRVEVVVDRRGTQLSRNDRVGQQT